MEKNEPEPLRNWFLYPLIPFCAGLAVHAATLCLAPLWIDDAEVVALIAALLAIVGLGASGYVMVVVKECDASIVAIAGYIGVYAVILGLAVAPPLLLIAAMFWGLIYLLFRFTKPPLRVVLPPLIVLPIGFVVVAALQDRHVSGIAAALSASIIALLIIGKRT